MTNFFKVRITVAVKKETEILRIVTKEVYLTVDSFFCPGIWNKILEVPEEIEYKIVSFCFLSAYCLPSSQYNKIKSHQKRFFSENELPRYLSIGFTEKQFVKIDKSILNYYRLEVVIERYDSQKKVDLMDVEVLYNSIQLLLSPIDQIENDCGIFPDSFSIKSMDVIKQYYIDIRPEIKNDIEEDFFSFDDNDSWTDEVAQAWEREISALPDFDNCMDWYDMGLQVQPSKKLLEQKIAMIERDHTLKKLIG